MLEKTSRREQSSQGGVCCDKEEYRTMSRPRMPLQLGANTVPWAMNVEDESWPAQFARKSTRALPKKKESSKYVPENSSTAPSSSSSSNSKGKIEEPIPPDPVAVPEASAEVEAKMESGSDPSPRSRRASCVAMEGAFAARRAAESKTQQLLHNWIDAHLRLTVKLERLNGNSSTTDTVHLVKAFAGLLETCVENVMLNRSAKSWRQTRAGLDPCLELRVVSKTHRTSSDPKLMPLRILFNAWAAAARHASLDREGRGQCTLESYLDLDNSPRSGGGKNAPRLDERRTQPKRPYSTGTTLGVRRATRRCNLSAPQTFRRRRRSDDRAVLLKDPGPDVDEFSPRRIHHSRDDTLSSSCYTLSHQGSAAACRSVTPEAVTLPQLGALFDSRVRATRTEVAESSEAAAAAATQKFPLNFGTDAGNQERGYAIGDYLAAAFDKATKTPSKPLGTLFSNKNNTIPSSRCSPYHSKVVTYTHIPPSRRQKKSGRPLSRPALSPLKPNVHQSDAALTRSLFWFCPPAAIQQQQQEAEGSSVVALQTTATSCAPAAFGRRMECK